jgi:hypothetical protein
VILADYERAYNEEKNMNRSVISIGLRKESIHSVMKQEITLSEEVDITTMGPYYLQYVNDVLGSMYWNIAEPAMPGPPFTIKE